MAGRRFNRQFRRYAGWLIRNKAAGCLLAILAGALSGAGGDLLLDSWRENRDLAPSLDESGHTIGVYNPSTLSRPLRKAELTVHEEVFGGNNEAAEMATCKLIFTTADFANDKSAFIKGRFGQQFLAREEELLDVVIIHPEWAGRLYYGTLKIWYGNARQPTEMVLKSVICRCIGSDENGG